MKFYALGCLAMAVTLACLLKWPAVFLAVGFILAIGAIGAVILLVFILTIIYFVMGPGAAR